MRQRLWQRMRSSNVVVRQIWSRWNIVVGEICEIVDVFEKKKFETRFVPRVIVPSVQFALRSSLKCLFLAYPTISMRERFPSLSCQTARKIPPESGGNNSRRFIISQLWRKRETTLRRGGRRSGESCYCWLKEDDGITVHTSSLRLASTKLSKENRAPSFSLPECVSVCVSSTRALKRPRLIAACIRG